ncbi:MULTISPECIES: S8 family serine peptidase [unclassified Lysobacter]|uniref:S8 family serine peptidase n=1 Tax=unclassified Lysobacter TaxID=2635362 RepID=UPI001BECE76A|nr:MULTISPECIES: S8 family serine peptidase [unclassified Lysobacter]MBT2747209.1 S8 family serine peptidase [Lysobacter sp. ISL-42]MBT2750287.1 S8 family serine peptidase [Lysobacter sp. ISL-50]MBT2777747.1 S8 family serine peptidase [Lysobacter sp. ISL-54]MBT2783683.1 S8 family serine peptidase [Lysobacter sp. ISL-52]
MKKAPSKKNTVIGLTAACAAILLWSQRDAASAADDAQGAAVAAVAGAIGSGVAVSPASLPVAYAAPMPRTAVQAKLGAGQLLQAVQALAPQLRTPAGAQGTPTGPAQAASVRAQIAALDRAGIPLQWREGEKVKINVGLALDYASIQNARLLAQAAGGLVAALRAGGIQAHEIPGSPTLEALVPLAQLEWVAGHAGVARVGLMNIADTVAFSDGATASGIDQLRGLGNYAGVPEGLRRSLQGEGLTIAIMDQFGNTNGEVASLQTAGEWPKNTATATDNIVMTPPTGKTFGAAVGQKHGNAVTEIAYDIAPKAKFRLYDAGAVGDWVKGIQDAANLDAQNQPLGEPRAQVITASQAGMAGAPGDGTATSGAYKGLYDAIDAAKRNGVLVINAAGNHAQAHWDGDSDGGAAVDVAQDFDPATAGVQDTNVVASSGQCTPVGIKDAASASAKRVGASLSWNDWASAGNTVDTDYRLELVRWRDEVRTRTFDRSTFRYVETVTPAGWELAQQSDNAQNGGAGQEPLEVVAYVPPAETATTRCAGLFSTTTTGGGGIFALRVVRKTASAANFLRIVTTKLPLEYAQNKRSLLLPADSASVVTVAALNAANSALELYSSRGPVLAPGGARPAGQAEGNAKPDLSSYAKVDTLSYGENGFSGTSSAAPHVAALALLGLQHQRQLTSATELAPLPAEGTEQDKADRVVALRQRRSQLADATYDALVQVAGTQGNDLGDAGFDDSFGTGQLKFHAQSQACVLSALYAPAYRSLLPVQASPLPAGQQSYDQQQTSNAATCSTVPVPAGSIASTGSAGAP